MHRNRNINQKIGQGVHFKFISVCNSKTCQKHVNSCCLGYLRNKELGIEINCERTKQTGLSRPQHKKLLVACLSGEQQYKYDN